jgi:tetratricopeptide (TPR) repeat protein
VATTLTDLGNAFKSLGDAQKSRELLERALAIKEKYYGLDHPEVVTTLTNLGNAYRSLGGAQKSRDLLERALVTNIFGSVIIYFELYAFHSIIIIYF